jgi:hypothetical protein
MPLWITRIRSCNTPYSDCTSCRIDSDTAMLASVPLIARFCSMVAKNR